MRTGRQEDKFDANESKYGKTRFFAYIIPAVFVFLIMLFFMWRISLSHDDSIKQEVETSQASSRIGQCAGCGSDVCADEDYFYYKYNGEQYCMCASCINAYEETNARSAPSAPVDGLYDDGYIHVYLYGEEKDCTVLDSSWITSFTYYPDCEHLVVRGNDEEYVLANVSPAIWLSFKKAESKGEFFSETFKGNPEYWVNDYDGTNGDLIVIYSEDDDAREQGVPVKKEAAYKLGYDAGYNDGYDEGTKRAAWRLTYDEIYDMVIDDVAEHLDIDAIASDYYS